MTDNIKIDGAESIMRDTNFDNNLYFSGGIRIKYNSNSPTLKGVKEGVLLEVGFDNTTPNTPVDISSWILDFALEKNIKVKDNSAF